MTLKKLRINDLKKGIDTNNQFSKKNISNCSKLYFTDQTNNLNNPACTIIKQNLSNIKDNH